MGVFVGLQFDALRPWLKSNSVAGRQGLATTISNPAVGRPGP